VIDPSALPKPKLAPAVQLVEATADGKTVDFAQMPKLQPGSERVQFRYTAIHLSAPTRVQFFHKLEGLDADWMPAGLRREINYNSLPHGKYRFLVRAELPGGQRTERAYAFEILPHFYETTWFRMVGLIALLTAGWGIYELRVRQLRYRFTLVLQERARLAREIHDTLAQGFIGISSQLEAVASVWPEDTGPGRHYLDLARKMARHSITEARRSIWDLRASVLEGQNLVAALQSGVQIWTAGSGVVVDLDVSGTQDGLPDECEHHLLRITQEAVTNAIKHAGATRVSVTLQTENHKLVLRILDDGHGFDQQGAFSLVGGHFGLVGMCERAERVGGELRLDTHPGEGTRVEVTVPLR
jgi:signal transduction histidine kinase